MTLRLGLVTLALMVAACSETPDFAQAQDIGALLSAPPPAPPPPQVAQELRPGISADSPARLLVIGDSLADGFGMLLVQRAPERGLALEVTNRGRVSTGLARADFYDWPARFAQMADAMDPDIVVAHFGANDMQGVIAPEGRTAYGTPGWEEAYRAQIRKILAIAAERGIVLYWLGPGPDGNTRLNAHLARINPWIEDEARRAGAVYFPVTPFTTPPDGRFARTVAVAGRPMAMRTADGSHFTMAGYRLVADRLYDTVVARFPMLDPTRGTGEDAVSRLALAVLQ